MGLAGRIRISILALVVCTAAPAGRAQIPGLSSKSAAAEPKPAERDPLGRESPYGSVVGFLRSVERAEYSRAVEYLDVKPSAEAVERAHQLQAILNTPNVADLEFISRNPEGDLQDGLPADRERVGTLRTRAGELEILLQRAQRSGRPPVWLVSSETLRQVPRAFYEIDTGEIGKLVPERLRGIRIFSVPLYRWLEALLGISIALLFAFAGARFLSAVLQAVIRRVSRERDVRRPARVQTPLRLILLAAAFRMLAIWSPTVLGRQFWVKSALFIALLGVTWLVIAASDFVAERLARRFTERQLTGKLAVLSLLHRLFKVGAVILGVVATVYLAGGDVTAILAGVGIGGIAIALGAQKTLENFFGGVAVISDEPIRVGDVCRFGDKVGTVEDIGLRSTRVRTTDRTVLTIPNGQLSVMNLENFTLRDKFLFNHKIGLRYETTPDQMRYVLAEIREMLRTHPAVDQESARIRLTEFGASALTLEVFAYFIANDYSAFLAFQEELLLGILDIVVAGGTGLAFPSQTMYVTRDKPTDPALIDMAAARVQQRREQILP